MTVATIESIKAKHPVRSAFSSRSSGNGGSNYYETKGHAVNAFDAELQTFDLYFDRNDCIDFTGDNGSKVLAICNEFERVVGYANLSWYRMPSGRYEFVGYIA